MSSRVVVWLFLPLLLFSFQDKTAKQKCVVSGRVINLQTGGPLKKANIHLQVNAANPSAFAGGYGGVSDAEGRFRFENVEPGDYSLWGDRTGFIRTQYGSRGANQSGTKLTLQPGQEMADLELKLIPQAVITGRVVDEDGEGVSGVEVQLIRQTWQRGKLRYRPWNSDSTNDLGEFRIYNLAAGKYFLSAQKMDMMMPAGEMAARPGQPDIRPVRTFFPDAISMENAAPVAVSAGQVAGGMDIRLQRVSTYHVRGKIAGAEGRYDVQQLILNVVPRDTSMMMFGMRSNVKKDFTFDLAGVAPGSYSLNAVTVQTSYGSGVSHQPIDVGTSDLNGVVLNIVPPGTLRGHVRMEGGSADGLTGMRIFLSAVEEGPMGYSTAMPAADGSFSLEKVMPGKYYATINGAPEGSYVKSVRLGQQEVLGQELDFQSGVGGELEIVCHDGAAEVSGTIKMPEQKSAAPNVSIVLAPDTLNADGSGLVWGRLDQNGAFSVKQVRPGHYRAYAFEKVEIGALQNPEVLKQLESKGTELELKENDKKQIQLDSISEDDLQQLFTRLGIQVESQ